MAGYLTTHVLDTAHGRPAAGMKITLFRIEGDQRLPLTQVITNEDGRTDVPILPTDHFAVGRYVLEFHVGDYFQGLLNDRPEPAFFGIVPIAFGLAEADAHYHVPLLVSPYGYSTYRGS